MALSNTDKSAKNSLLKNHNFLFILIGQMTSWLGTEVSGIALPLLVLSLTGSPAQAGSIAAMRGVAYVVWALPAGVLVDRWNRRTIMIIANVGSGIAMGTIAAALLFKFVTIPQLYLMTFIEGSFFVFANLCRLAVLPKVVTKEQFPKAVANMNTVEGIAILTGSPLGGFLYQAVGAFLAFFTDAVSYFINALLIFFIDIPLQNEKTIKTTSIRQEVHEGITWLWNQPTVRFMNLLTAGKSIMTSGLYLLIIVLVKQHHATSFVIGSIFAIAAIGGILGSFIAPKMQKLFRFKQLILGTILVNFIFFSLYTVAFNIIIITAITVVLYAEYPTYDVASATYSAHMIPDEIRGRITSLTRLVTHGAYSFGFFIMGILLQYVGSFLTILLFSGLLLCLMLFTIFNKNLDKI